MHHIIKPARHPIRKASNWYSWIVKSHHVTREKFLKVNLIDCWVWYWQTQAWTTRKNKSNWTIRKLIKVGISLNCQDSKPWKVCKDKDNWIKLVEVQRKGRFILEQRACQTKRRIDSLLNCWNKTHVGEWKAK